MYVKEALEEVCLKLGNLTGDEVLAYIKGLRQELIQTDGKNLREAAAVLNIVGKSFQRDLYERISVYLDGMNFTKTEDSILPVLKNTDIRTEIAAYEKERGSLYDNIDIIRGKPFDESIKRELYVMTWELDESALEDLLLLFREAILRYHRMHRNILSTPRGVNEIKLILARLGIAEVEPEPGETFDPGWHICSDPQKVGFGLSVIKTTHVGYKRNGRRILKAIVEV